MKDPINKVIMFQSSKSVTPVEETAGLLEKVNSFIKQRAGFFNLTITPTGVECRYSHACGVNVVVGDSVAAASDAVSDVMSRAQSVHNMFDDAVAALQAASKPVDPAQSFTQQKPSEPLKH